MSLMSLCKTGDPWVGAIFDPRATVWTIFVKAYTRWIYIPNIKFLGILVSDKKIFEDCL